MNHVLRCRLTGISPVRLEAAFPASLTGPWAETDAVNPQAEFRQTNSFFRMSVELAP